MSNRRIGVTKREWVLFSERHQQIRTAMDWLDLCETRSGELVESFRRMPYKEYLETDHWKTTRRLVRLLWGCRCMLCSSTSQTEVHHRSYENFGCEKLTDLILLCRACHEIFHEEGLLHKPPKPQKHKIRVPQRQEPDVAQNCIRCGSPICLLPRRVMCPKCRAVFCPNCHDPDGPCYACGTWFDP